MSSSITPSDRSGRESAAASPADGLREFAGRFDQRFERLLTPTQPVPERLREAVRYTALAPGKRIRPFLVVRSCELVGGRADDAWPAAAAIECVHAFSLVHDDLPAMDNDRLRRGRPTCHVQFDVATAILAGDALLALAFELLARCPVTDVVGQLVGELAAGAGWAGMIGGQLDDIAGQHQPPNRGVTVAIHTRKTAKLFETACRMGALAGRGGPAQIDALGTYGHGLGRAFQIADDLLDVTANAAEMGKATGKDATARKQTFPASVGVEASRAAARQQIDAAVSALTCFGTGADDLRRLAEWVLDRKN